ncbi:3813_t:CDS:2 [Entrophospora sp. SA101]|nr:3813_t:CDS:2 [Entrophospora sp. SA101]
MNNTNSIYGLLYNTDSNENSIDSKMFMYNNNNYNNINDEKYKSSQFHYMDVIQEENKDDDNINNSLNNYYNNDLNNGYYNGVTSKPDISRDSASHLPLSSSEDDKLIYGHYYTSQFKDDALLDQYAESVDRYGFEVNKGKKKESKSFDNKRTEKKKKEIERSQKWASWLTKSKSISRSGKYGETSYQFIWDKKFVERVYKGIPDPWRGKVCLSSTHEKYIDLDVPRTLQSHIMFKTRYGPGQRSMFNVLKAFSNYDQQVGFCQGMANIVAILLLYYSEEDSFVMLIKLFSKCNLHSLYVPGFPSLMEGFYIQKKLMELYVPKLTNRFVCK